MFGRVFAKSTPLVFRPTSFFRPLHTTAVKQAAASSGATAGTIERYGKAQRWLHWIIAGGFVGSYATIHAAYRTQGSTKDTLMKLHNTFGIALAGAIAPRVLIRLLAKQPAHVPVTWIEEQGSYLGHALLYVMMLFMPVTGIAMTWFGGKGQPLIIGELPGKGLITADDAEVAKHSFKYHKMVGDYGMYLLGIHMGAAFWHTILGRQVFTRMNPWA